MYCSVTFSIKNPISYYLFLLQVKIVMKLKYRGLLAQFLSFLAQSLSNHHKFAYYLFKNRWLNAMVCSVEQLST
jgi:hypothetical protein